jgi:hypothetical protein
VRVWDKLQCHSLSSKILVNLSLVSKAGNINTQNMFYHMSTLLPKNKSRSKQLLTSGFRRDVDEICALLGYYAASCGNCLPIFRDNVSVLSSRVKSPRRLDRYVVPKHR